jgi:serine/threonine-protein kinase
MPHIRETGVDDGVPFLVMDYVRGCSIEQLFDHHQASIPLPVTLGIIHEVALALEHLHELSGSDGKQLVRAHRDVTPRNVLLQPDGTTFLIDFGLVTGAVAGRQTATNVVKGTWRYAAPEQLLGRDVDSSVDIYGLGALLYRMAAGRRPFDHVRELDDMRRAKEASALSLEDVPEDVADLIEAMTQPEKENRIKKVSDVVERLESLELASKPLIAEALGNSVLEVLELEEEREKQKKVLTSAEERDEDVTDPSTTSDITRLQDCGGASRDEDPEQWVVWLSLAALVAGMVAVYL